MAVYTHRFQIETRGNADLHDITAEIQSTVAQSGCQNGTVTAFVTHTTAAIVVGEHESGLLEDTGPALERVIPSDLNYRHNVLNADDNAHSHLIGTILGPSETIPVVDGRLTLGTWQRVQLIELDTHPRSRRVVVQVMGE